MSPLPVHQRPVLPAVLGLLLLMAPSKPQAQEGAESSCQIPQPYVAPPYTPPQKKPRKSQKRLVDNGDGTLTDLDTGLMWTREDSYSRLDQCLNFNQAREYVDRLDTGGYTDWRIPTIEELQSIYDPAKENVISWDHDPEYPLALDEKFADGAAYWYWSNDCGETELTACCARSFYFVNGLVNLRHFDQCNNGGVRAVRTIRESGNE